MMSKKWYVVHAYSGFEKSVQRALCWIAFSAPACRISSARSSCRSRKWSR